MTLAGGCQCGAVRYRAKGTDDAVLCHCRMCQRAVGNAFGWMVSTVGLSIEGAPGWFRSSSAADRGFCVQCGTPMFFRLVGVDRIWVTGGSLDDPSSAPPRSHYGTESRWPWVDICAHLPGQDHKPGGITGKTVAVQSNQSEAKPTQEPLSQGMQP